MSGERILAKINNLKNKQDNIKDVEEQISLFRDMFLLSEEMRG